MRGLEIAVVGCGSAGPAAAMFLQRAGHSVQLFERVPELLPVGAGFTLQPTGLSVLQELGLLDPILERGAVIPRLRCETSNGRRLLDLHYHEVDAGFYGIGLHRATLMQVLADGVRADGIPLHLGCEIDDVRVEDGRATLCLDRERRGPFDLVIVADGARSALRGRCAPNHRADRYPWGALWYMAPDPDGDYEGLLYQVVEGTSIMVGTLPTGRTMDDDTPLVSLFWGVEIAAVDQLRAAGIARWKQELLRVAPHTASLAEQIDDFDQLTVAHYMDVRMRPWNNGPILFIGDAAHATSPQLGQGVNLALVDARAIAEAVATSADVPAALRAYGRIRKRHLAYYQLTTRWLTPFFQSRSRLLGWVRDLGFPMTHWFGPFRRQMIRTMCGIKRGFLRRSMVLSPLALPPADRDSLPAPQGDEP